MLRNYVKVAWRNLARNKTFSITNIVGLALGISCSLLILLWAQDERSVDAFHTNGDHLFQVYERQTAGGQSQASYTTQGLLAQELKRQIPEIQFACGFEGNHLFQSTFEVGDKINKLEGTYADTDFFQMFSFPLLQGTARAALTSPGGVAVSRRLAEEFFGSPQKAIGQTIRYEAKEDLLITAVFENLPANSSLQFDFLRSWSAYGRDNSWLNSWTSESPFTFVQLRADADPLQVEAKIKRFINRYRPANPGSTVELALQPYPERYLHSTFKNGQIDGGRIEYVRLFSLMAVFILLIACINFMNLSTARATKRAKEVGVRKVIGAIRGSLIGQYLGEAMLLTLLAVSLALVLVALLLSTFNSLTGKQVTLPVGEFSFWMTLLGLWLATALVAGSYPALFLSSLKPARVLKGSLRFGLGATFFRKGLVVFQFVLSISLIAGMIVIYQQVAYIQQKNLGYSRENLLYIPIEGDLVKNFALFKAEATRLPGIVSLSRMRHSPTIIDHGTGDIRWLGKDPTQPVNFSDELIGYDFVHTMKLALKEGRDFSPSFGQDSVSYSGYLINETALKTIGYQHPIGKPLWWGERQGTILGVVKDFHFQSMHEAIQPLIMRLDETKPYGTILVRIQAGNLEQTLSRLESLSKRLNPKFPFTYQFSDQEFANLYRSEQVVGQLASSFAILAILISCLGLLGLATFTAEQRTREIGVRKVLGASVYSLVALLSKDFVLLVLLALGIATPLAWWAMHEWLQGFAYRIDLELWVFALAGLLAVGVALLTVSFQSIKAALINPINSLGAE